MTGSETGAPLLAGQRLLQYEILEKLGESAGAAVYKARDTQLDRVVALKVLARQGVIDNERFAEEARIAATLEHPNLAKIHDVARSGETDFVVMEYVAGQTLERVLQAGPLERRKALAYALEIAGALAAAHAVGITHRHLNPRNVMVTAEGRIQVLDAGIAAAPRGGDPYLAPEQIAETGVDARSDIYSLGLVLEKMLTGRDPGERPPGLSRLWRHDPLEGVIDRLTRKQAARRFQLMEDVKQALEKAAAEPPTRRPARRGLLAAAGVAVIAVAAGAWWFSRSRTGTAESAVRLTSDAGLSCDPAISRDGKVVAFASDRGGEGVLHIWARRISAGAPAQLTQGEEDDHQPAVSPDGARIVFRSERDGGGLYAVPAAGGEARLLVKDGRDPRFSPDGSRIAYWTGDPASSRGAAVYVMAAAGGEARHIQPGIENARYPAWSPDGKHLLFLGTKEERDWWVTPADGAGAPVRTGARTLLGMQGFRSMYSMGEFAVPGAWWQDRIIFAGRSARRDEPSHLHQIPISAGIFQTTGASHQITTGTDWDTEPSVASDGRVVFTRRTPGAGIWSLPLDGKGTPRRLVQGAPGLRPSISQDGKKLAFRNRVSRKDEVWVQDLETGKRIEETSLREEPESSPLMSPGGDKVAYRQGGIFIQPLDGAPRQRIMGRRGWLRMWCWFSDGKRILCERGWPPRLVVVSTASEEEREAGVLSSRSNRTGVSLSPDDRWLLLETERDRRRQIFIASFREGSLPAEDRWIAVTPEGTSDRGACWSPDGNLLYFLSDRDGYRCIWGQRLEHATKKPAGAPFAVHHFHHARYALASDASPGDAGLAAARDKLVFSVFESAGSIWMLPSIPRLK